MNTDKASLHQEVQACKVPCSMFMILPMVIILCTLLVSICYGEEKLSDKTTEPKIFSRSDSVKCGGNIVSVTTTCIMLDDDYPYCYSQDVAFISNNNKDAKVINFIYPLHDYIPEFIVGVACGSVDGKLYVFIDGTNYSNCSYCEWTDLFLPDGRYIGSSKGLYFSKNLNRKVLSNRVKTKLEKRKIIGSVRIIRIEK